MLPSCLVKFTHVRADLQLIDVKFTHACLSWLLVVAVAARCRRAPLLDGADGAGRLLGGGRGGVPEQRQPVAERHPGLHRADRQRLRRLHRVRRPRLLRRLRLHGACRPRQVPARQLQRLRREGGRAHGAQRDRLLPVLQLLLLRAKRRVRRLRVVVEDLTGRILHVLSVHRRCSSVRRRCLCVSVVGK